MMILNVENRADSDGNFAGTYAAQSGTLYVVRPDGHLAARGLKFPLAKLGEVLRLATCN